MSYDNHIIELFNNFKKFIEFFQAESISSLALIRMQKALNKLTYLRDNEVPILDNEIIKAKEFFEKIKDIEY